jgi:homoserine O-succinyltransferase
MSSRSPICTTSVPSRNPDWLESSAGRQGRPIVIGLVNNMPDQALSSTERQFRELMADAASDLTIVLRVFSIPDTPRSDAGRQYVRDHHETIEDLWGADLDGLIVTGTEPRAADLADEPYWPTLIKLVDWAVERAVPSVWSCLAAHAAVQYLDGIRRRTRSTKLSGVFECVRTADHPLLRDGPACWRTPHSRYNDLPEEELASHGYQILVRSPAAGADVFIKQYAASFLFMQGHPEYEADALLREYRRDVSRFLAGVGDGYPEMPFDYFDNIATEALMAFRTRALLDRRKALIAEFPMALAQQNLLGSWQAAASRLYANWISYLVEQKSLRRASIKPTVVSRSKPPAVAA